jgi:hypothetical protein
MARVLTELRAAGQVQRLMADQARRIEALEHRDGHSS